jgi:cytidylate kinase
MAKPLPCILTISRQLGSGGAFIGHQLACRLGVLCADREILVRAARQFQVTEGMVEDREESVTPLWLSLLESFSCGSLAGTYSPPPLPLPTDAELRTAEADVISRIAQTHSAVIVGRGGFHVLRTHPRHISVFLHADKDVRRQRLHELYGLSNREAEVEIERRDCARARYHRLLSGRDWADARQYHLCLDTSALGIDPTIEVLLACWRSRFGMPGDG